MIRFIIKRHEVDHNSGSDTTSYQTLDINLPALQKILEGGGRGEIGFESFQLIGAEVINRSVEIDSRPTVGFTGCLVCGAFTDHGGLQCPRIRL